MADEKTGSGDATAGNQGQASLSGGAVHGSVTGQNMGTINNTYYHQPSTTDQQNKILSTDLRQVYLDYVPAIEDLLQHQEMVATLLYGNELHTPYGREQHGAHLTALKLVNTLLQQISMLGSAPVVARAYDLRTSTGSFDGFIPSQVQEAIEEFIAAVRKELGSKDT